VPITVWIDYCMDVPLRWAIFKQKKGFATIFLDLIYCSMGSYQPPTRDTGPLRNNICSLQTTGMYLKGQSHEIFDPRFFSSNNPHYRALIHGLKPFRIWLRIHRENRVRNRQNCTFFLEFPFNIYVYIYIYMYLFLL
jgi:hypothetical protein